MSEALATIEQQQAVVYEPAANIIARQAEWATALMAVVEEKKLYKMVGDKKYLYAEAWQLICHFAQVSPRMGQPRPVHMDGELVAWEVPLDLVDRNGMVVGGAVASCGLDAFPTRGKEGWDKHRAAQSSAGTWALSKAARLKYSVVAVLAGYASTPAEEMTPSHDAQAKEPERICPIHNVAYFKSKNMRSYAHKYEVNGEEKWCNEPKAPTKPPASAPAANAPQTAAGGQGQGFPNAGAMLTALQKDFGVSKAWMLQNVPKAKAAFEAGDLQGAYDATGEHMLAVEQDHKADAQAVETRIREGRAGS